MSRENKTQYAILGSLSKVKQMSGYDIKSRMNKMADFYWAESNAQLYPLLKKLAEDGMVTMTEDSTGPRKKYLYSITENGLKKLLDWIVQIPAELPIPRNEWLLKISLGQHLEKETLLMHLNTYLCKLKEQQKKLDNIIEHIKNDHKGKADQKYLRATYRYGELITNAKITWCEEMLKAFS